MHHFTDRHPETLDMASASDSLRRRSWPPESGGKVATEVVFPRFHSWILVMHGNVYVRLFLFVSVYFICGFAKCLLCFQLRNNIWTFSVFFCIFVVSVASLNNCWKVICGSRLARHVIDDANRGCRAKITWQTRNKTNLPEEPKEAKQNTKDIWMSSETKVQKHAKSEIWDLGFKKTYYEYDIALSNKVSVPLKLYWMLLSNSAMG